MEHLFQHEKKPGFGELTRASLLAGKNLVSDHFNALVEATIGFEPMNEGFADPCLTTWLRRRERHLLNWLRL
jgi:hypothetical protein